LFVVMVAPECSPVAQAGGLGDVVAGLSRELEQLGHTVEIVLPRYDCLRDDRITEITLAYEGQVPWYSGAVACSVWSGRADGHHCHFIEPHSDDHFFRRGHVYGSQDDVARFAFFSKAAMEFLYKTGRRPDVIHCHDWETALVPVLLYEIYQPLGMHDQRACLTIHNFRHQGIANEWVLWATGLLPPQRFLDPTRMHHDGRPDAVNLLKGGIVYSNSVTTVSPRHAWEVRHADQGWGLGDTLHLHGGKFDGILNGLDADTWSPETDACIPQRYAAETLEDKAANTRHLRRRFGLRKGEGPVVAYVGRLDAQKGVHLIHHALFYTLGLGGQFVVLGASPDPAISNHLQLLDRQLDGHPDVHLELQFNQDLAHLVYAGADILVMPSMFEPCGLVQQIALSYGTVPVVRATGGLIDTVHDRDYSDRPPEERNGFVFEHTDPQALESALWRAIDLWRTDRDEFRTLMLNGMRRDRSWTLPAQEYLEIYEDICHQ
jgi:starch synthase